MHLSAPAIGAIANALGQQNDEATLQAMKDYLTPMKDGVPTNPKLSDHMDTEFQAGTELAAPAELGWGSVEGGR